MKQWKSALKAAVWMGFIAATLQGSRLPEEAVNDGVRVAGAFDAVGYRAGSGSDKEEYPPRSDSMFA